MASKNIPGTHVKVWRVDLSIGGATAPTSLAEELVAARTAEIACSRALGEWRDGFKGVYVSSVKYVGKVLL